MTKKNQSTQSAARRTKAERTKALAAVFKRAGFTRKGANWHHEQGDLLWSISLDSFRRDWEDETPFDIHVNARYLPALTDEEYVYLFNGSMGPLPGTHADSAFNNSYREYDPKDRDPLVLDAEELLVPLIKRLRTLEDVLDARLSGEPSDRSWPQASRVAWVYSAAGRLQRPDYLRLTQQIVNEGNWTIEDRIELEKVGMTVPPETRIPESFFERSRRRIHQLRDRWV